MSKLSLIKRKSNKKRKMKNVKRKKLKLKKRKPRISRKKLKQFSVGKLCAKFLTSFNLSMILLTMLTTYLLLSKKCRLLLQILYMNWEGKRSKSS